MPAPLEHFDKWDIHKEGTQASIRRVTDALDNRTDRGARSARLRRAAFPAGRSLRPSGDEWMYGRGSHDSSTNSGDWREKIVLTQHRYMLEDVRTGPVVSDLGRRHLRACRRRWRRRSSDRRRGGRRGFHGDRPDARRAWGLAIWTRQGVAELLRKGLGNERHKSTSPVSVRAAWGAALPSCSPMPAIAVKLVDFKGAQRGRLQKIERSARAKSAMCW